MCVSVVLLAKKFFFHFLQPNLFITTYTESFAFGNGNNIDNLHSCIQIPRIMIMPLTVLGPEDLTRKCHFKAILYLTMLYRIVVYIYSFLYMIET